MQEFDLELVLLARRNLAMFCLLVHILEHGFAGPVPWLLLFPMFSLLDLTDCLAERIIKFQSFQNLRYVV